MLPNGIPVLPGWLWYWLSVYDRAAAGGRNPDWCSRQASGMTARMTKQIIEKRMQEGPR